MVFQMIPDPVKVMLAVVRGLEPPHPTLKKREV